MKNIVAFISTCLAVAQASTMTFFTRDDAQYAVTFRICVDSLANCSYGQGLLDYDNPFVVEAELTNDPTDIGLANITDIKTRSTYVFRSNWGCATNWGDQGMSFDGVMEIGRYGDGILCRNGEQAMMQEISPA